MLQAIRVTVANTDAFFFQNSFHLGHGETSTDIVGPPSLEQQLDVGGPTFADEGTLFLAAPDSFLQALDGVHLEGRCQGQHLPKQQAEGVSVASAIVWLAQSDLC